VNFTHEGLSLWYRTPEAYAPEDDAVVPRKGAALVVGVHPASPTNSVQVRYRVDRGAVRSVAGRELRTDFERQIQFYAVKFPDFPVGDVVEYEPLLTCAGRQVPAPNLLDRFPSRFRLGQERLVSPVGAYSARPAAIRFAPRLDFVATVFVQFEPPQFIGETPLGIRVNFLVREGTAEGAGFRAKVTHGSSDQMLIRRDGMGQVRIRAGFATDDGVTLDVEAGGYVDFGPEGYRRAAARDLPDRSPLVVSPLISTRDPRYDWLSRIQCVGAGQTQLDRDQAFYHVYTARPRDIPATR
jgi:uncharacterized protein DUF3237